MRPTTARLSSAKWTSNPRCSSILTTPFASSTQTRRGALPSLLSSIEGGAACGEPKAGLETAVRQALDAQPGSVRLERDGGALDQRTSISVRESDVPVSRREANREICGLCGAGIRPLVQSRGMVIGRCQKCSCGIVVALPPGTATICYEDYAERYENDLRTAKADSCYELLQIHANGLEGVTSVLDIGCGRGEFLDLAQRGGLRTAGVEISLDAATRAVMRGHEVLHGSATDTCFPAGVKFDAICMWDVLEHLDRPGDALRNTLSALAPNGRLFIATPMMGSIYDRVGVALHRLSGGRLDQLLRMCWSHDHLYRFDPRGLSETLCKIGYARATATRIHLLSLRDDVYAGGTILPFWTASSRLNRWFSVTGVQVSRILGLSNKVLVEARGGES